MEFSMKLLHHLKSSIPEFLKKEAPLLIAALQLVVL
jgi:hypothetical protein